MEDNKASSKEPAIAALELAEDEYLEIITMGEVESGDVLVGSQGRTAVVETFDEHIPRELYSLETDSGLVFEASGNHLIYMVHAMDRDLHKLRLATGKSLAQRLSKEVIAELKELAEAESTQSFYVANFLELIGDGTPLMANAVIRTAESLGPIAESNIYVDDLDSPEGSPLYDSATPLYSSKLMAQQLLSLFAIERARKRWPLIVGRVVPVSELVDYDLEDIYIPDPIQVEES